MIILIKNSEISNYKELNIPNGNRTEPDGLCPGTGKKWGLCIGWNNAINSSSSSKRHRNESRIQSPTEKRLRMHRRFDHSNRAIN